jgi:hypothetical protein
MFYVECPEFFFCFCCLVLRCLLSKAGLDKLFMVFIEIYVKEEPCAENEYCCYYEFDSPAGTYHRLMVGGCVTRGVMEWPDM